MQDDYNKMNVPADFGPEKAIALYAQLIERDQHGGKLHPDLVPHIYNRGDFTMISHPWLVYTLYQDHPMINAHLNAVYEYKEFSVKEALERKQWGRFLAMHEKPYKFDAFLSIEDKMDDVMFTRLAVDTWTYIENCWQQKDEWYRIFTSKRFLSDHAHERVEDLCTFRAIKKLDGAIEIHRGANTGGDLMGMSWTLDYGTAEWFATRLLEDGEDAIVLTVEVPVSMIAFAYNGRGEYEVVVPAMTRVSEDSVKKMRTVARDLEKITRAKEEWSERMVQQAAANGENP